ncbi:hypothetical protein PMAYCL1PPCAC_24979, partial [Pristionchus mayeri]
NNFVLRCEMDRTKLATGKAVSEEYTHGGFNWIATSEKSGDSANFAVRCVSDHKGPWKCEIEVGMHVLQPIGYFAFLSQEDHVFDENNFNKVVDFHYSWSSVEYHADIPNHKFAIEFRIRIIRTEKMEAEPGMFAAPNNRSDVILKIGEKRLHVSREFLAVHSPVFETLFFGDFAEKGKEEVEIKDVVYEEFLDLLHLIYLGPMEFTDRSVTHILKLGDQFQMERVLKQAEKYLTKTTGLDEMKKLIFADQYRLGSLRDHCLDSFTTLTQLTNKIKSSPDFALLSDAMKAAICERVAKLA